jgi:hypothetical protein
MTESAKTTDGNGHAENWKDGFDGQLGQVSDGLGTASEAVLDFIKEKPVICIFGALAVGYVFGRIVRR